MLKFTIYLLRIVSILSLLYFFLVLFVSGIKTSFLWFFAVLSGVLIGLSFLLPILYYSKYSILSYSARTTLIAIWTGIIIFTIVQIRLITFSHQIPVQGADYIIILGAQVRGTTPSKTLNMRIHTAYSYLMNNKDTKVICSGGN